nr:polyketide synthase dehydratase domain-containing protein [Micromonospora sp. DSM 115978]
VVFDGAARAACQVQVEPGSLDEAGRTLVRASVRGPGVGGSRLPVPHYAATLVLAAAPPIAPRVADWPAHLPGQQRDGLTIYETGAQFHGPRLQGMRRVLVDDSERLVLECRLDDDPALCCAYGGAWHSPVLADVLLQGPPVLGKALLGQACLPLGVRRAEYFAPLPDGSPYFLVVAGAVVDDGGTGATATATACDAVGVARGRG